MKSAEEIANQILHELKVTISNPTVYWNFAFQIKEWEILAQSVLDQTEALRSGIKAMKAECSSHSDKCLCVQCEWLRQYGPMIEEGK